MSAGDRGAAVQTGGSARSISRSTLPLPQIPQALDVVPVRLAPSSTDSSPRSQTTLGTSGVCHSSCTAPPSPSACSQPRTRCRSWPGVRMVTLIGSLLPPGSCTRSSSGSSAATRSSCQSAQAPPTKRRTGRLVSCKGGSDADSVTMRSAVTGEVYSYQIPGTVVPSSRARVVRPEQTGADSGP